MLHREPTWNRELILLSLCIMAGIIGGLVSSVIFKDRPAFAETAGQSPLLSTEGQEFGTLVQAQEIRLTDKSGNPLAVLTTSVDTGEPFLALYSKKDGKYRIMLDVVDGNPRIILRDEKAQTRLVLGGAEVMSRLKGSTERRSTSSIVMFNPDGKLTWSAP